MSTLEMPARRETGEKGEKLKKPKGQEGNLRAQTADAGELVHG